MSSLTAGRTGTPFTMVIELGNVAEFAKAIKSANPAFCGEPATKPVNPRTFLAAAAFWKVRGSSPLSEQERDFQRVLQVRRGGLDQMCVDRPSADRSGRTAHLHGGRGQPLTAGSIKWKRCAELKEIR